MRAIIIEDKDCKALLDKLLISKPRVTEMLARLSIDENSPREGLAERVVESAYSNLRHIVVDWLQEQGFKQH